MLPLPHLQDPVGLPVPRDQCSGLQAVGVGEMAGGDARQFGPPFVGVVADEHEAPLQAGYRVLVDVEARAGMPGLRIVLGPDAAHPRYRVRQLDAASGELAPHPPAGPGLHLGEGFLTLHWNSPRSLR